MSQLKLEKLTDWAQLERLLKDEKVQKQFHTISADALKDRLSVRVRGQEAVVCEVSEFLSLQLGKLRSSRPLASFIFLGPTGTGKTELAKAIAEVLSGDQKAFLRFDCSEFSGPDAKTRLIGVPTGYVGSDEGGHLTRPVSLQPQHVILFDEVEKAYPGVFDLFLQLLGEGRLTEQGSGRVVDFTQTVIIFTSNAQAEKMSWVRKNTVDPLAQRNALKQTLVSANVFRSEFLGRIDRIHVFDALAPHAIAEVAMIKLQSLAQDYGLELVSVDPRVVLELVQSYERVASFGVRELERLVFDRFAGAMLEWRRQNVKRVSVQWRSEGVSDIRVA